MTYCSSPPPTTGYREVDDGCEKPVGHEGDHKTTLAGGFVMSWPRTHLDEPDAKDYHAWDLGDAETGLEESA